MISTEAPSRSRIEALSECGLPGADDRDRFPATVGSSTRSVAKITDLPSTAPASGPGAWENRRAPIARTTRLAWNSSPAVVVELGTARGRLDELDVFAGSVSPTQRSRNQSP